MEINEQNVQAALLLAQHKDWENVLPDVKTNVRIAVNSLLNKNGGVAPLQAKTLTELILKNNNSEIREIIQNIDLHTFAFALRRAIN